MKKILVLPGDGIGKEVIKEAVKIMECVKKMKSFELDFEEIGESAIQQNKPPLSSNVLEKAKQADAVLFGAVGGVDWNDHDITETPESALLKLRTELGACINVRPAKIFDALLNQSVVKPEILNDVDLIFVRELVSDIYYGEPRGMSMTPLGRAAINTMYYNEEQIRTVAEFAFSLAMQRKKKISSVSKHNVLETSQLWKIIVDEVALKYPEVWVEHLYVDNANLQIIKNPRQFDVILSGNLFGDILSELTGALMTSIGCVPSASLNNNGRGIYEPIHGSAPDIAGKNIANPIGAILSVSMMFTLTFQDNAIATLIETAVHNTLKKKIRTLDIAEPNCTVVSTSEMGDAILSELNILIGEINHE